MLEDAKRADLVANRRRFMFAAAAGMLVAFVGLISSKNTVELVEYCRGSMMAYEVNTPFPALNDTVHAGQTIRFTVVRNSDFGELSSNWTLFRMSDRDQDGVKESERVDGGHNLRVLTLGKVTYIVPFKVPDWIEPGDYYIAYSAEVSWRSYKRKINSETVKFTVLPSLPNPL